jgi:hypothetical protein
MVRWPHVIVPCNRRQKAAGKRREVKSQPKENLEYHSQIVTFFYLTHTPSARPAFTTFLVPTSGPRQGSIAGSRSLQWCPADERSRRRVYSQFKKRNKENSVDPTPPKYSYKGSQSRKSNLAGSEGEGKPEKTALIRAGSRATAQHEIWSFHNIPWNARPSFSCRSPSFLRWYPNTCDHRVQETAGFTGSWINVRTKALLWAHKDWRSTKYPPDRFQ